MLCALIAVSIIATATGCGLNEVYKDCKLCDTTCEYALIGHVRPCPVICEPGCACITGFVREWVPFSQCLPASTCGKLECKSGEEYQECGALDEPSCENPFPKSQWCIKGCYCQPGLVRGPGWDCISPDKCQNTQKCAPGEVWVQCKGCDATCDNKEPACPRDCRPGCACQHGYVRFGDLTRNYCGPVSDCPQKQKCGNNEVFKECMGCTLTCNSPKNAPCPAMCLPGCECQSGYLRDGRGNCIKESSCPGGKPVLYAATAAADTPSTGPKGSKADDEPHCAPGMKWNHCGTNCPLTCSEPEPRPCPRQCSPGCFCNDGTIMDLENGICVPPEKCPGTEPQCPENEEFIPCGSACVETCTSKPTICTANCVPGCFCKKGFVRDEMTNQCIEKADCPKPDNEPSSKECTYPDMEFNECGSACPPSCFEPNPTLCTYQCVPGCFCKAGKILSPTGICISKEQCPQNDAESCPPGSEFHECGSTCPATCEGTARICNRACKRGCFCKFGYVVGPDGNCIKFDRCPKTTRIGKLSSLDIKAAVDRCKGKQDSFPQFCKVVRKTHPALQFCTWRGFRESCPGSCCLVP